MNLIKKGTYINKGEQKSGYLGIIGNLLNTEISELFLLENMTKDRPYRSALSHEDAVAELIKYTGLRYDKHIVDALIEVIKP